MNSYEYDKLKKGEHYTFLCSDCGKETTSCKKSRKFREQQLLFLCRGCAIKRSCLSKYGVNNVFQLEETKEKSKKTCLSKYNVPYYNQSEEGKKKFIQRSLETYGVENPFQSEIIKEKSKKTCLSKYGVSYSGQSQEIKTKGQKTLLKKYGKEFALQVPYFFNKARQTTLDRHGVFPSSKKYFYDSNYFDSSWELCYYIFCKENNISIIRSPKELHYSFKDKDYIYQPDFLVENKLVEIKGDQFFEGNKLINPFDRKLDCKAEAKQKCMIENNVKIISKKEIKKYLDYVNSKYGKHYIEAFRR